MKTDRELLELAAKAAGIKPRDERAFDEEWGLKVSHGAPPYEWWNPLIDDGEAFRLAVKLHMALTFTVHGDTHAEGTRDEYAFQEGPNAFANARRAIVRAAAEIALAAKETT
jgi:hypothetical protein